MPPLTKLASRQRQFLRELHELVSLIHITRQLEFFFVERRGWSLAGPMSALSSTSWPSSLWKLGSHVSRMASEWVSGPASSNRAIAMPAVPLGLPHTLPGIGRGLLSWRDCPVPLAAVINREVDEHGQSQDRGLVTTAAKLDQLA